MYMRILNLRYRTIGATFCFLLGLVIGCGSAHGNARLPEYRQLVEYKSSYKYQLPGMQGTLFIDVDYREPDGIRDRVPKSITLVYGDKTIVFDGRMLRKIQLLQRPRLLVSDETGIGKPVILEFPFGFAYQRDIGAHACAEDIESIDIENLYYGSCTISSFQLISIEVDLNSGIMTSTNLDGPGLEGNPDK